MDPINRVVRRMRSRWTLVNWIYAAGWAMLAVLAVTALLLVVQRLFAIAIPMWAFAVAPAVALVLSVIDVWRRRPDEYQAAVKLDSVLGLKDQISTALYVRQHNETDPSTSGFRKPVLEQAVRAATAASIHRAMPLRLPRIWGVVVPASLVVILVAWLMPPMDLMGLEQARRQRQQQQAAAVQSQEQVVRTVSTLKQTQRDNPAGLDEQTVQAMKQLASLSSENLTDPLKKRQAVAALSDVQEKLGEKARQKQSQLDRTQAMFSQLDSPDEGPVGDFADALKRGDYQAAQKHLQNIAQALDQGDAAQKQQLQHQVQNMQQQLQQMAQQQKQMQQQAQQNAQQQLQNAGVSKQQIQQLKQQGFQPQQVQQALQQQGRSQQQAQQQAQQIQQQMQQSQQSGQCSQCAGGMAQSMQQMQQASQQGQSAQPGAFQGQQNLQQMTQMQSQLNRMRMAQQQAQQAMQSMSQQGQQGQQGQQMAQGGSSGQGQQPQQQNPLATPLDQQSSSGVGPGIGSGSGGSPVGQHRQMSSYHTKIEESPSQGQGRVIASWQERGQMSKGQANVTFDQAVTEARQNAERAVTEDRVPRRYHRSIKDYFDQLPNQVEADQAPSGPKGPPAPR